MLKTTIDFETKSLLDLKKVGGWMYSRHPSTEVMVLKWKCGKREGRYNMAHPGVPASDPPWELFEIIKQGGVLEAHNSMFEYCIWKNICVERLGWPRVQDSQWRCSAAKAAACALPRDLGGAGNALGLDVVKDEGEGKKVLMKMTKPAKPTKAFPDRKWHEEPDDVRRMWKYNEDDVYAEEALSAIVPELSPLEQRIWEMDQRMNRRGICADVDGARIALDLADKWVMVLNDRLNFLSGGLVTAGTQRDKVKAFLLGHGLDLEDTQAGTLDLLLKEDDLTPLQREVLEIVRATGRTSIKKYQSVIDRADEDGRIRDSMMYHGASTGRWAGRGIQPHNFPRGGLKDMEQAWRMIHSCDLDTLRLLYGDPMTFLSYALRGVLWAPPGRRLYCGDYAAIEARVLLWLCGDEEGLDVFRRGEDIYVEMAMSIYGRKLTKKDKDERQLGKQAILGLGFGMGYVKFLVTCRGYNMRFSAQLIHAVVAPAWYQATAEWIRQKHIWRSVKKMLPEATETDIPELVFMKYVTDKYRARFVLVKAAWYDVERAAIAAVNNPGKRFSTMKTTWAYMEIPFPALRCKLPSGRILWYPYAEIHFTKINRGTDEEPKWEQRETLTYMTIDAKTHQWVRTSTYGGKLAENITQAVARDVMAESMLRCDEEGLYKLVASVHDEIICETAENEGDLKEFLELIAACPDWAPDLPIGAEGWTGTRYRKQ